MDADMRRRRTSEIPGQQYGSKDRSLGNQIKQHAGQFDKPQPVHHALRKPDLGQSLGKSRGFHEFHHATHHQHQRRKDAQDPADPGQYFWRGSAYFCR